MERSFTQLPEQQILATQKNVHKDDSHDAVLMRANREKKSVSAVTDYYSLFQAKSLEDTT